MGTNLKKSILFFLCVISLNSYTQNKRFHHITSKNGLSQSEVYCFLKDSRGYMWFGTVDGLNSYDGHSIKIFNTNKNNPQSLSNNTVRSLAEDKLGRIWIGTDDGLNMYDPNTESVQQIIPVSTSNQKLTFNALLPSGDFMFLATSHGLYKIDLKDNYVQKNRSILIPIALDVDQNDLNTNIMRLIPCRSGGFWMLTSNMVSRIIIESHSDKAITIETPFIDPSFSLFDLTEDHSNNLWFSCNRKGLFRFNTSTKQLTNYNLFNSNYGPSSSKCSGISVDDKGNIWLGTLDNGLNVIPSDQVDQDKILFEYIQHNPYNSSSLNSNLIRDLYVSDDDILWIGTIGAGVNFYDSDQKNFNHLPINTSTSNGSNFIRAVYVDSNDRIWAGTHSNGLYELNRDTRLIRKLGLDNKTVFYITAYNDQVYMICCDDGLYLIELRQGKIHVLSHFETNATFYITKGQKDYYWLASYFGLYRLKIRNNNIIVDKNFPLTTANPNRPQNCRVLHFNRELNKLFVGTEGGGLYIISLNENQEADAIKVYKSGESSGSLSNNYIRSIIQDSNGQFWIGTYEGLNKVITDDVYEELSFKCYTIEDGLPNNMIHSIVEDNQGHLWIGTNNGLSKFMPSKEQFVNYSESDGIQSNEFSEHTAFKTKDGELILGGINGITAFFPEQITSSSRKPQTTITDFYIGDNRIHPNKKFGKVIPLQKGISMCDTITLAPKQNNIGFDFSSMLYPNPEKIKYAFMLEGFDKNWQYTDVTNRHANYTNLKHGKYTFKLKSTNSDGIWEEHPKSLFIHIKTPFKYTWYAYVLYLLGIALILVYFSYYSIIRYTTKNKLLLEHEHNHKIQSLNKLRTQFFINISHDLRTPLTLIKGPLESILKEKNLNHDTKGKLTLIKRNVKRLNYLIEQLLDVRRTEGGKLEAQLEEQDIVAFTKKELAHFNFAIRQKGLKYTVHSSADKIIIAFDTGMLSKVYFNLISNALKYTESGEISIFIIEVKKSAYPILQDSRYESFVKIEVADTGKGIPKEKLDKVFERFYQENATYGKGYGIGLSHTQQLIDAHSGYIDAESEEGQGTVIRFFIPDIHRTIPEAKDIVSSEDDIYREDNKEISEINTATFNHMSKTILVVEDNADMRSYIKSELIPEYNVLEAEDGIRGIEMAENHDIDLIISDIMMPNLDGMAYCRHIKTNLKTSHIPVILLTAKTDKQSKYKGIETGADDYISKPFEMEYLVIRIKNLLQSREQLRKIFQTRGALLEPSSVTLNSIDEKFLTDLLRALEEGIPDSEFSVSTLESSLGMSHSNFYRKVKSLTGQSGKELLQDMRMNRAKQILRDNKKVRIDEVAYMVGFTNPKYFGKSFKETFGISPSEMKRKKTHNDNS